ncbi:hypothetical protein AYO21_09641 [Fonsecaea monophora]|uniref:Uncharacterized protein n=1 Tax=Fonsecaea monophora TaxID=254056 RepID=A0A177EVV6_9EURO|nr:hypothetical protein AYO21_09641 [Fonsecaea monophora]OAG36173.1 hypothetical protein AYO21_09641 [Fonsecaea monophora]
MPSTPELFNVLEADADFDAEALYYQRREEEMTSDGAEASPLYVQGFYYPTSSNRDDRTPAVFAAFRDVERFPLVKVEYEEWTPEERESSRRDFVQYMHDGDRGIESGDSIIDGEEDEDYPKIIRDPQSDYQWFELEELQSLKCIHHFNVFGRPVLTKSGTAPATTIAILKSTPKHLNVTTPNGLWKSTIMGCAQQLLDPVCYYGNKEALETLRGSRLENACIGQSEKIYSQHGWWVHDHYGPEEYKVMADPLDPCCYPDPRESVVINGITKGFAHRVDMITAATQEKEKEDAARKAAFSARLAQGRQPSRLGRSCLTHEDVEQAPVLSPNRQGASSPLRHSVHRPVSQPTTTATPVPANPWASNDTFNPERYSNSRSLSRAEWKELLTATEDRPVAARWADDEEEDEEEEQEPVDTLALPLPVAGSGASSAELVIEGGKPQSGNDRPSADRSVEDVESLRGNDDRRVCSASTSTTVEQSRGSSASPGGTPDTSLHISDNEDAESKAITDDECESGNDGSGNTVGDQLQSEIDGFDDMPQGQDYEAIYTRQQGAELDTDDESEEELLAFAIRTQASSLHARLDALEEAMQTAATSSMSQEPLSPVTPRAAGHILGHTDSIALSPTSTLVGTPESLAPTFVDSPRIPTPTPRYRGLSTRSNPPVVVLAPTGPLPSGPRPVVHQFPNGTITMTLPGQQLDLVRSHAMRFDQLSANFGTAEVQRAPVPSTRILSGVDRSTTRISNVSRSDREAGNHATEAAPQVTVTSPQDQASPSTALVLHRSPVTLNVPRFSYLQAWSRLTITTKSNGERFWQGVIRGFCIQNYRRTLALERAASAYEVEDDDITLARAIPTGLNYGDGAEEDMAGNIVHPNLGLTQVAIPSAGVLNSSSPEAAGDEQDPSSAQAPPLQLLRASIQSSTAPRQRHEGRHVRFSLPPGRPSSIATANSNSSPLGGTIRRFPDDTETITLPSTHGHSPTFNGVHCVRSPPPVSPSSITWAAPNEVSYFSSTSSDESSGVEGREPHNEEEGDSDGEEEQDGEEEGMLRPVPPLPVFQRTRKDWRHASWTSTQRRRLTKHRPPSRAARATSSVGVDVGTNSTATMSAGLRSAKAKTKDIVKKSWKKLKAMCTKRD